MSPENGVLFEVLRRGRGGEEVLAPVRGMTVPRMKGSLHGALRRARIVHAVSKPETLAIIMLTVFAMAYLWLNGPELSLPGWAWFVVLSLGPVVALTLIATTLTDPSSIRESAALALEDHFNVRAIADDGIRGQIAQAAKHRARMAEVYFRSGPGARDLATNTLEAVDHWLSGMGRLARRLESFQAEFHLQSETRTLLLQRVQSLERRIGEVTDRRITDQLRETLAGRRHQLRAIEELESLVERGLLRLEHAVAALGTVHAQLAMVMVRGDEPGDAAALAQDIDGEIREIDAVLAALDRVHDGDRRNGDEQWT